MTFFEHLLLLLLTSDIIWGVLVGAYMVVAFPIAYLIHRKRNKK